MLRRDPSKTKILLFACVYGYAGMAMALQLNFTATSVVAFLGGVLILILAPSDQDRPEKGDRVRLFLGSLCLIASFLSRPTAFFFSALVCFPYLYFCLRSTFWGRSLKRAILVVLLLTGIGYGLDLGAYALNARWESYFKFKVLLTDFTYRDRSPLRNPDELKTLLKTIGWTSNDLALFENWYFYDPDIFTSKALARLLNALPHFGWVGKPETFRSIGDLLSQKYFQDLLFIGLALLLGCQGTSIRRIVFQTAWTVCLILAVGFVAKTPSRLVFPPLVFAVWWALIEYRSPDKGDLRRFQDPVVITRWVGCLFLLLSFVFLAPNMKKTFHWDQSLRKRETAFLSALTRLGPRSDQLYIAWAGGFPLASAPVLGDRQFPGKMRLLVLDEFQRTPISAEMLARFSIRRPFRDLVGRSDVFLILRPRDWPLVATHLWEHDGIRVRAVPVFAEDPLRVVRVEERVSVEARE